MNLGQTIEFLRGVGTSEGAKKGWENRERSSWEDFPAGKLELNAGPVSLTAYRSGGLSDSGRGIFFADSEEGAKEYSSLHGGSPPAAYRINAKNVAIAPNAAVLYRSLYPGKSLQDAVWLEDKKSGLKSSVIAHRKVEARIAAKVRSQGMDAIIYTDPPAPAEREVAVIGRRTGDIISRKVQL